MHRGGWRHSAARCTAPGRDLVGATKMCPGKTCPPRGEQLEKSLLTAGGLGCEGISRLTTSEARHGERVKAGWAELSKHPNSYN